MGVKIEATGGGVRIWVKVVPGSSRDRIVGELGEALKIAVSKPPAAGAANAAVVALLAAVLELPKNQIQIESGHSQPRKRILVSGISAQDLRQRLKL
jgi:uncharacterized protein (TIGR00251 family)